MMNRASTKGVIPDAVQWRIWHKWSVLTGVSILGLGLLELTGCSTQPASRSPIEERTDSKPIQATALESHALPKLSSPNAGKPGYYTVKPGDTVMQVGRNTGQNWRDILRWNNLDNNPNQIEVGQVLRVTSPEGTAVAIPIPIAPDTSAAKSLKPPVTKPDHAIDLIWPSKGPVIARYDGVKNKGLKMAGNLGDAVMASADGRVVFAGSSLRGYGNMIIVKHNEDYLTAYAHNQTLLVKENQTVRKGQKIATMGSSDTDRVMLHFEVRYKGKPVDPMIFLPPQ